MKDFDAALKLATDFLNLTSRMNREDMESVCDCIRDHYRGRWSEEKCAGDLALLFYDLPDEPDDKPDLSPPPAP